MYQLMNTLRRVSVSLQNKLIEISQSGYVIAYKIDKSDSSYFEAFSVDPDIILEDENYRDTSVGLSMGVFSMADAIERFLQPGTYFFVFKSYLGGEWWTKEILPKTEQKKIEKTKKRKLFFRKLIGFIKKNLSTIIILITIICCSIILKF